MFKGDSYLSLIMVSTNTKRKLTDKESNERKEKIRNRRRKRETIIIPAYRRLKTMIIESIVEIGKKEEYFTYIDVFIDLVGKLNIDLKDMKKQKALYNYINSVMLELEDEGYVKGYRMPGQRRIFWKLIRSPISTTG